MTAAPAKPLSPVDQDAALDAEIAAYRLLNQLRRAGFTLSFTGETLHVSPSSRLDADQRQALKAAKPQILALLKIEAAPAPQPAPITWSALPPAPAAPVACGDCRHSATPPQTDAIYGWRRCSLGIEGGGGFAQQDRQCGRFEVTGQEAQA